MSIIYNKNDIIKKLTSKETFDLFYKYNLKNVVTFGSINTDDFNDYSDIDLAIIADKKLDLDDILEIELYLENILKREIDIIDLNSNTLDLFVKINILNCNNIIYSIDDKKSLVDLYNKTDLFYRDNKDYIFFRRMDVLS